MGSRIKLLVVAFLTAMMFGCAGQTVLNPISNGGTTVQTSKAPVVAMLRSTVRVNKGGSGVVIKKSATDTWVLTAWHVIRNRIGAPEIGTFGTYFPDMGKVPVEVRILDGEGHEILKNEYQGTIEASSPKMDLALVKVPARLPCMVAKLATSVPKFGDIAWVVGHPLGKHFMYTVTKGVVSHPMRKYKDKTYMQIDAGLIFGNSGGPVFNNAGRLIGIADIAFILGGPTHLGFAVPLSDIRLFLRVNLLEVVVLPLASAEKKPAVKTETKKENLPNGEKDAGVDIRRD